MNSHYFQRNLLLAGICASVLLASTPSAEAKFNLPEKQYWAPIALTLAIYSRLVTKEEPDKDRLTLEQAIEGIIKPSKRKDALWKHLLKTFDHVFIGFQGKKGGAKVFGSRIEFDGIPQYSTNHVYPNGEKIEWFEKKSAEAYGFLGTVYSHVMSTLRPLKDVKEANETLSYFGLKFYEPTK